MQVLSRPATVVSFSAPAIEGPLNPRQELQHIPHDVFEETYDKNVQEWWEEEMRSVDGMS